MHHGGRLRILLVDDEEDMLALLRAVLTRASALWEVVAAAESGPDALRVAEQVDPDVAIVDYRMAGMNGIEVCEHLKAARPDRKVILYTAYAEDLAATGHCCDHYVAKTAVSELTALLERYAAA